MKPLATNWKIAETEQELEKNKYIMQETVNIFKANETKTKLSSSVQRVFLTLSGTFQKAKGKEMTNLTDGEGTADTS